MKQSLKPSKPFQLLKQKGALYILMLVFTTGLHAQPEVAFEFESTFGKKGFYDPGPLGSQVNANPPTGFLFPTGIGFQSATRLIVADYANNKLQTCDDTGASRYVITRVAVWPSANSEPMRASLMNRMM